MCGILGSFNLSNNYQFSINIEELSEIKKHRGPVQAGFFREVNVDLAHRRLSINDFNISNLPKNLRTYKIKGEDFKIEGSEAFLLKIYKSIIDSFG